MSARAARRQRRARVAQVSGGGLDFVIVHLEYCPPTGAVQWAAGVVASYPDRIGMMTTHAYLDGSATRKAGSCVTQYLWDQLAVPSANLRFMMSGHISNEADSPY